MPEKLEPAVSALLAGEYEADRLLIREIFRRLGWRLFEARSRRQALRCLRRYSVQVVIAESEMPLWNWRKALADLRRLAAPPQLVVTSRAVDDSLWAEVLNVGGYDVLALPLERDEVERVVDSARRHFDVKPLRPLPIAAAPGIA